MKEKKKVLIITDDSEKTAKMAAGIVAALNDNDVLVRSASEFKGNDILPAEVFFLGCENAEPDSFAYLADVLKHINLAGRPCGIFSPGPQKAVKYLSALVKDCEATLNPEPLVTDSAKDIKKWAKAVIKGSF